MPARTSTESQRGNALIDALVGMLILSLVVAGSLFALAQGAKTMFSNNLRAQVIDQLRAKMAAGGVALCGTNVSVTAAQTVLSALVTCTAYDTVTVAFPGVSNAVALAVPAAQAQVMTVTTTSSRLGGTLTVSSAR